MSRPGSCYPNPDIFLRQITEAYSLISNLKRQFHEKDFFDCNVTLVILSSHIRAMRNSLAEFASNPTLVFKGDSYEINHS